MSSNLACRNSWKKRDFILPRFILMTDDERTTCAQEIVRQMPPDAAVIVRSASLDRLKELIKELRPVCDSKGIALIAATRPELASQLDVDGVHLSEAAVKRSGGALSRCPGNLIVTATAHSVAAVRRARQLGVDGILIAPVFPTRSHPGGRTLGSIGYRKLASHAPEQACPLGGMTMKNLGRLKGAPVAAIAGTDMFLEDVN